jgi:hypothetical protein
MMQPKLLFSRYQSSLCLILFMLLMSLVSIKTNAQSNLVATDSSGIVISTTNITLTFLDVAATEITKEDWLGNHPEEVTALRNAGSYYYYEIHQADFDVLSDFKKAILQSDSARYHLIP